MVFCKCDIMMKTKAYLVMPDGQQIRVSIPTNKLELANTGFVFHKKCYWVQLGVSSA